MSLWLHWWNVMKDFPTRSTIGELQLGDLPWMFQPGVFAATGVALFSAVPSGATTPKIVDWYMNGKIVRRAPSNVHVRTFAVHI